MSIPQSKRTLENCLPSCLKKNAIHRAEASGRFDFGIRRCEEDFTTAMSAVSIRGRTLEQDSRRMGTAFMNTCTDRASPRSRARLEITVVFIDWGR